jgi:hypothetical protein
VDRHGGSPEVHPVAGRTNVDSAVGVGLPPGRHAPLLPGQGVRGVVVQDGLWGVLSRSEGF